MSERPTGEEKTIEKLRQRPARRLAVAFAAVLIALASAAPAGAHAVLVETQPGNGTVLETWPDRVLLRFNEPVDASLGALRVYDSDAERVDSGRTSRPDAQTVAIELGNRPLARGTYTVAWRIVSADSHPLHGAFVFSVKSKSDTTGVIGQLLEDDPHEGARHRIYRRAHAALAGLTSAYMGRSCLTREGALYLGIKPEALGIPATKDGL